MRGGLLQAAMCDLANVVCSRYKPFGELCENVGRSDKIQFESIQSDQARFVMVEVHRVKTGSAFRRGSDLDLSSSMRQKLESNLEHRTARSAPDDVKVVTDYSRCPSSRLIKQVSGGTNHFASAR